VRSAGRRHVLPPTHMQIRVGYELVYDCPQPTPMVAMLSVHPSRSADVIRHGRVTVQPGIEVSEYRDVFDNVCTRIAAPRGKLRLTSDSIIRDSGLADPVVPHARQVLPQSLPAETLQFLLGSRYCETDLLYDIAWTLFGHIPAGWARVQNICDFVHRHIVFNYAHANPTRTAYQVLHEKRGVCRDFAHLALTFCRCMNIPARYCTGYLGDIGLPPPYAAMDFAGWFEVYLEGGWYTFDARNNTPRIGRVLIARGRDAADVAITTSFGLTNLQTFRVWTDEISR
jgi:transglutaminase-like putative cysteine protease